MTGVQTCALPICQEWQALIGANQASVRLAWWDGKLLLYFVGVDAAMLFDFDEGSGNLSLVSGLGNPRFHVRYTSPDGLWMINNRTPTLLFAGTNVRGLTYLSRTWELPKPVSFATGQIRQEGTTTVKVYADEVLKLTHTVTGNGTFRLPAGFLAHRWHYELSRASGMAGAVRSFWLAESAEDLKHV